MWKPLHKILTYQIAVKFGFDVQGMDDVMKCLNALGKSINSYELNQWACIIETTAREECKTNTIRLTAEGYSIHVQYDDERSKECIIRAINRHVHLMPLLLQGIFRKLANDMRSGAFTQ